MDTEYKSNLIGIVNHNLDRAENIWNKVGPLVKSHKAFANEIIGESVPSEIPGHPVVDYDKPEVGDFIAFVLDMRNSTNHLLQRISEKDANVSELERVFYETSALLPAMSRIVYDQSGKVTEYLGDGLLSFFKIDEKNEKSAIYNSHKAANKCISAVQSIVSPILMGRYRLPEIKIGIGLARSKAVVTVHGLPEFMQPKVIGRCVYFATKLASIGYNEIYVDKVLKNTWPSSKGGTLSFKHVKHKKFEGYLISTKK